jgi:plasmid stability protein
MQTDSGGSVVTANLTIRRLDPAVKERLRIRAAQHGRSMEEEARRILSDALTAKREPANAFDRLRQHFAELGDIELELPPRLPGRDPPTFE